MDTFWVTVFESGWGIAMGWMTDLRVLVALFIGMGFIVSMLSVIGLGRR